MPQGFVSQRPFQRRGLPERVLPKRLRPERFALDGLRRITVVPVGVVRLLIEITALGHHVAAPFLQFHVLDLLFRFEPGGFCGGEPSLLFHWLPGAELVFHRHQIDPVALPLLFFPAGTAHTKLLQHTAVQLLEFVLSALINDDPIRAAADDLVHRHLPCAEDAFPQQRNTEGSHHQGGEFPGFDVEGKAQNPSKLPSGFGDHLAIDHPAVALRIEAVAERIG